MSSSRLLLLFFVVSSSLFSHELTLGLRYRHLSSQVDVLEQSFRLDHSLFAWLKGNANLRFSQSLSRLESVDYSYEATLSLFEWWQPSLRFLQINSPADGFTLTKFFFHSRFSVTLIDFIRLYAGIGWYEGWTRLSGALFVPNFFDSDTNDHDFAAEIGAEVFPSSLFSMGVRVATFESIDAFQLNNPFLQIHAAYHPANWGATLIAFARYRILLGFGRLDELAIGTGLKFSI